MAFHGNEIAKTIKFISETPVRLATPGEWPFPAAIRQMANTAALAQLPMHGTAETDDGNNGTANANGIIGGANRPAMVRFLWERKLQKQRVLHLDVLLARDFHKALCIRPHSL